MKRTWMTLSTALVLAGGLCLIGTGKAQAQGELTLGFLTSDSGPFVTLARTNELAATMALDEINAAGGISGKKLRYITFDTAGTPGQAVVGLRKLAEDDKVLAIIGPLSSGQVQVAAPAGDRAGVVTMSMSSSAPKLVAEYKFAMRNTSDESYLFDKLLSTLKTKGLPASTAAIAYANDDIVSRTMGEKVFPALMKNAGVDVKLSVDFKYTAFDLSAQVAKLKESQTDLIGIGAPEEAAVKLVQELRRQGHKGRMIGGTTIANPDLPVKMGKDGDGTVISSTYFADLNDRSRKFAAEFTKRAKAANFERQEASQFDAATYDIVQYYAWAMKEAKVTGDPKMLAEERTAIRAALGRMKDFPALVGLVSFGPENDALKPAYILEARDGKWTLLNSYPAPK